MVCQKAAMALAILPTSQRAFEILKPYVAQYMEKEEMANTEATSEMLGAPWEHAYKDSMEGM